MSSLRISNRLSASNRFLMKIDGPLKDAIFIARPNRFLTVVQMDGQKVESHLPDPGRLNELLIPGASLKIRHTLNERSSKRKTQWTTVMVKTGQQWVSIDSTLPNRFVKSLLKNGKLSMLRDYRLVRSEIKHGNHRFDFLLEKSGCFLYLEVKSVTLMEEGMAMFPDAVTDRGARHMEALSQLVNSGFDAAVLFVCQRPDVILFRPQWNRDPKFAKALLKAEKAGVKVWVITSEVTPEFIQLGRMIPYDLSPF